jgi:hypothetical protein
MRREDQSPFSGVLYGTLLGAFLWLVLGSAWLVFY